MMDEIRIGIDAKPIAERIAGIGRYVLEICKELDKKLPSSRFFLYSPYPISAALPSDRWGVRVAGGSLARSASSYLWLKACARRMAISDRVQLFWATRTILPLRSDLFKTVATVYDLNYYVCPYSMPYATYLAHRLWFVQDIIRADSLIAISQGTANRLVEILGVGVNAVARPGVGSAFKPQTPQEVVKQLRALGVNSPYFLAVGTLEPRKNLETLIKAFLRLKYSEKLNEYSLLIVGSRGWRERRMLKQLEESKAAGVHWLGFLPDNVLARLYAGAAAFVCPSIYEGFGIPMQEARACGTRLLATDIPELREAGGPQGVYVKPTVEGLSMGLLAVLTQSLDPAGFFVNDWEKPAQIMADVFRRMT